MFLFFLNICRVYWHKSPICFSFVLSDLFLCGLVPIEERVALATGETVVFLGGNCEPDFPGKKDSILNGLNYSKGVMWLRKNQKIRM